NLLVDDAETFKFAGSLIAQDAGYESHDRIGHHGCCELAAAQNVIADRKLHVAIKFVNALVNAFIAAAEEDNAVQASQLASQRLGERAPLCGKQDHAGSLVAPIENHIGSKFLLRFWPDSQRCESFGNRFRFEHHAFSTAEWAIINGAVAVVGKIAQIRNADRYQALGLRTAHDAVLKYPSKEAGEDGNNFETHIV